MTDKKRIVLPLMLALLVPSWALGQAPPRRGEHQRARTFLVLRLSEELNLPDEKALQVSRLIRESDQQRRQLRDQREQVGARLRETLAAPGPEAGELQKLITQANEIDEQSALVPERTMREVQKLLTVEQQARLVLFRPELQHQIRRAMRRRMKRGPE